MMKHLEITNIFSIILFLFFVPVYEVGAELPLFRELVKENSRIDTIDAEIEQYIKGPGNSTELFKGRYRADNLGRFRIDYQIPYRQIVVNNGRVLYWYYPGDRLLYKFGEDKKQIGNPSISPLYEFSNRLDRDFKVNYLGKHLYGFFIIAHQFVVEIKERGLTVDIWIDVKSKVVLAKIVRNREGREIIKELYEGYKKIGGIYFPSRVDVYAKTKNGVTRNTTYYKDVRLNLKLRDRVFSIKFPKDIRIRNYNR